MRAHEHASRNCAEAYLALLTTLATGVKRGCSYLCGPGRVGSYGRDFPTSCGYDLGGRQAGRALAREEHGQ